MMVIPSIDLMGGKVVRLIRGDTRYLRVYHDNPIRLAEDFIEKGIKLIHVVDLDAALGRGSNRNIILNMALSGIPIQVSGGIRDFETIASLLDYGVKRVILGTLVYKRPKLFMKAINYFGRDKIGVALDYRSSRVVVGGWRESLNLSPIELATQLQNVGVEWLIVTSVERDGTLKGPDTTTLSEIRRRVSIKVIAAGGISSISDILTLKEIGVNGVIIGRALYEGLIKLEEVLEVVGECH
ncbi:MAG TPA: 1-(5-phosphoribosyl)-5-[(5-phosphoribosylamino)methylideneamino]imidazole-4-carboxamide isomerase [Desulfurococcales archaeon]|nr:1-(5-phosphoribosyl)-5-[(5-phosphoribosylamino)methylideneamino]imidazole-4-carboxamide isomerase [Desulfurococcales archaeon]